MARVGRLAGAILAKTGDEYFLVGRTKEPCDFRASGFEVPAEVETKGAAFIRLVPLRDVAPEGPYLTFDLEGEALAEALAQRFVIERNGSVSERLWRLVLYRGDPDFEGTPETVTDARWLGDIPGPIWHLVRSTVLRCV